jgi:hypothetical protein
MEKSLADRSQKSAAVFLGIGIKVILLGTLDLRALCRGWIVASLHQCLPSQELDSN